MSETPSTPSTPETAPVETKPEDNLPQATITLEEAGAARKRIKVEVPRERITAKLEEAYKEFQRDAVLPGFRRGRAPRRLIEKRFGNDLKATVKNQLVAEAYQKAVDDNKFDAVGEPECDLSKVELPDTGPMTATMEVEITPEFELPSIEKVGVKKPKLEANDARVDLAVENLRKHFGHWDIAAAGAAEKDTVLADVKVQDPDNHILNEQQSVQLVVGPGSIAGVRFEDLGDRLKGAKGGDTVVIEGIVPDTHPQDALRGKKLTITLTVKEVKHLHLPEVNEEFVKSLGFDSVEQLRSDLRERLVVQLEIETKNAMAQQVYRYLLENTKLDLPPNLSQRQMANVLRRRATEMMQRGVPESEIVQHLDQLRIASAQQAAVDLKLFFVLGKLAKVFDVDVSDAELNGRIAQIAYQYGRRPERVRHEMQQAGQLEQLYLQVRDGKVVDKILETAEVTEVDEQTLADEFKKQPPLSGFGPNIQGVSATAPSPS